MWKWIKLVFKLSFYFIIATIIGIFSADFFVKKYSEDYIYSEIQNIPHNRVGLVLGTSKYVSGHYINLYYKYRIDATVALYKAGKIDFVLVSGDNSTKSYDEPTEFKKDLVANGIPEDKIYLDYAGFRTFDSIIRAHEIFQLTSFTIISQKFHNERAITIARFNDLDVVAFSAKDVPAKYSIKVQIREYFARVKMLIDGVIGTKPKFLGEKIEIK